MAIFPFKVKVPKYDHTSGMRQIDWSRSNYTRLHAGCDLYAPIGTPIYAIADGTFQWIREFYDSTNQLVIFHPGIGVVRYGEVMTLKDYKGYQRQLKKGYDASEEEHAKVIERPELSTLEPVKEGDLIAAVGDLRSLPQSMLHFELYGEAARNEHLKAKGLYNRHAALLDPTEMLQSLEIGGPLLPGTKPSGKMVNKPIRKKKRKKKRRRRKRRARAELELGLPLRPGQDEAWMFRRNGNA